MIGTRLSHYEILATLGAGEMGVLYKARDTRLDRLAALKILGSATADEERRRRFSQEAKAASALNHPGIVTIYDIARDGAVDFIAMEYVRGKTLDELIARKPLPLSTALDSRGGALYSRAVTGGPERQVLTSILNCEFHPTKNGIFYVTRPDAKRPISYEIRYQAFATGASQTLYRFEFMDKEEGPVAVRYGSSVTRR